MDFRLHTAMRDFLVSMGLKDDYDLITYAGAIKGLAAHDQAAVDFFTTHIEASQKLHQTSELYLINHTDCGAYGGSKAFNSIEEEREQHRKDLATARTFLTELYPDLTVHTVLARMKIEGESSEIDFQVV